MSVNFKEDIRPISYIKSNAAEMMKYVSEHRNPIIITQNGEARAALMDIDSYQEMIDAFNLLRLVKLAERDVELGKVVSTAQVMIDLKKKYQTNA